MKSGLHFWKINIYENFENKKIPYVNFVKPCKRTGTSINFVVPGE